MRARRAWLLSLLCALLCAVCAQDVVPQAETGAVAGEASESAVAGPGAEELSAEAAAPGAESGAEAGGEPEIPGGEAADEGEPEEEEEELEPPNAVLFLFAGLTFGLFIRRLFANVPIPYTGILVIWGLIMGLIDQGAKGPVWEFFTQGIKIWDSMDPDLFLLVFLPILLFASGSALDWHVFYRNIVQIFTLAFPGVGIHMVFVAVIYKYLFPYSWTWVEAFLYGGIISATDPVAVVAIMKEVGASKRLGHLIEGESLINDGSAYVFFVVFYEMYAERDRAAGMIVLNFFKLVILAGVFGVGFGILSTIFLMFVYRDEVVEITLTVCSAYLCYWCAEEIGGVSGVLSVVTLSVFMAAIGKYSISPDVVHSMHVFWESMEFIANTIVFFYFGVLIAERVWEGFTKDPTEGGEILLEPIDWVWAIANWAVLNVLRLITLAIQQPFMNLFNDGFSWKDVILGTWAGLRGAVGLSLALTVDLNAKKQQIDLAEGKTVDKVINKKYATIIVFYVGTMAVITILLQGATMPMLLAKLGLTKKTPVQLQHLLMAAKEVEEYADRNLAHLKEDSSLGEPDWPAVLGASALDLRKLLPSKVELARLLGGTPAQVDALWEQFMNEPLQSANKPSQLQDLNLKDLLSKTQSFVEREGKGGGADDILAELKQSLLHTEQASKQDVHTKALSTVQAADKLLKMFQERRGKDITRKAILEDVRARYLHAVSAVFAEGFENGYLSGEQNASLHAVISQALEHVDRPLAHFAELQKSITTPVHVKFLVKTLEGMGMNKWADKVLFWNMDMEVGMVAAFVHAHDEANKGMLQLLTIMEDTEEQEAALGHDQEVAQLSQENEVVNQVIGEGKLARDAASSLLSGFRRDYPTLVRAVKTRTTTQTVLMHKKKFIASLASAGLLEDKEANVLEELIQSNLKNLYFTAPKLEMPTKSEILRDHFLFEHMSVEDIAKVLQAGDTQVFDPNSQLYKKGDAANKVFVVLQGTVSRRDVDGNTMQINGPGAAIGLSEVLCEIPRKIDVVCETTVHMFYLSSKAFRAMMHTNAGFRLKAFQTAAASVAMQMHWHFMAGMTYQEVLRAFRTSQLLPTSPQGTQISLPEPAILMHGSVLAFEADISHGHHHRSSVARASKHGLSRFSHTILPPGGAQGVQGTQRTIQAPALLQAGQYPAQGDCVLLTMPDVQHEQHGDQRQDQVRNLALFRTSAQRNAARHSVIGSDGGKHPSGSLNKNSMPGGGMNRPSPFGMLSPYSSGPGAGAGAGLNRRSSVSSHVPPSNIPTPSQQDMHGSDHPTPQQTAAPPDVVMRLNPVAEMESQLSL